LPDRRRSNLAAMGRGDTRLVMTAAERPDDWALFAA
jgi:hypothetical protein